MSADRATAPGTWTLPGVSFALDARRTALLVVDMQLYFVGAGRGVTGAVARDVPGSGSYFYDRVDRVVVPALRRLLDFFRAGRLRVLYTNYASLEPDGSDLLPTVRERNAERLALTGAPSVYPADHPEAGVLSELAPRDGERVIVKTSASPFNSTGIDQLLRNWGVTHLLVAGGGTSGCVDLTARDAADRGYRTVLVDDGSATWNETNHLSTLRMFAGQFGRVACADELIAELASSLEGAS